MPIQTPCAETLARPARSRWRLALPLALAAPLLAGCANWSEAQRAGALAGAAAILAIAIANGNGDGGYKPPSAP